MQSLQRVPQELNPQEQQTLDPKTGESFDSDRSGGIDPKLHDKIKSGARWFYWIAALSLLNTVLWHTEINGAFVVGLGMTQLADGLVAGVFGSDAPTFVTIFSIMVSVAISGGFALFGYLAARHSKAAFIAGLIFYALDTLLFLLIGEWFGLAFHVIALLGIFGGIRALGKHNQAESSREVAAVVPVSQPRELVRH